MKPFACITVILLVCMFNASAQTLLYSPNPKITEADSAITRRWQLLSYNAVNAPQIKIPKRKHDSPLFCNELMPVAGGGYIINSIATAPGAGTVTIHYDFYYLSDNRLYKLKLNGMDTIESIAIAGGKTFVTGKLNGRQVITYINRVTPKQLINTLPDGYVIGGDSWVKLGTEGDIVYAMDKNGLYKLNDTVWEKKTSFSLDSFYTQKLHYRKPRPLLPTENIRINGNKLYFLQEVLQGRDCYLVECDINTGELVNFWDKYGIRDNYHKEINSYTIQPDGGVYVAASRLIGSNMLMKESKDLNVLTFNNGLKGIDNGLVNIVARKVIAHGNGQYIIAENGIFNMDENGIKPLAYLTNTTQEIKEDGERINFDFYPRCAEITDGGMLLVGGQYGGLYLFNIADSKVLCIDDVAFDKILPLDITHLP